MQYNTSCAVLPHPRFDSQTVPFDRFFGTVPAAVHALEIEAREVDKDRYQDAIELLRLLSGPDGYERLLTCAMATVAPHAWRGFAFLGNILTGPLGPIIIIWSQSLGLCVIRDPPSPPPPQRKQSVYALVPICNGNHLRQRRGGVGRLGEGGASGAKYSATFVFV
jgi:hypothetical protein